LFRPCPWSDLGIANAAQDEFNLILDEKKVITSLNALEDLIAAAKLRKARSTSDEPPVTPHTLPAPDVMSAHLQPIYTSQQSQLNARLQTTQSQNAMMAQRLVEQRREIEEFVAGLERVVGDLERAGKVFEVEKGLGDEAREAEVILGS
jgi:kinetochore protein NNF1